MSRLASGFICIATAIVLAALPGRTEEVDVDIHPTGKVVELPPGSPIGEITFPCTKQNESGKCTISEYMEYAHVCALIVVKSGKVRLERYRKPRNSGEKETKCRPGKGLDRRDKEYGIASVTKSITSTLLGYAIATKDKAVSRADFEAVLNRPMQKFIPALAKDKSMGGYHDKSLDRVLRMRSGVRWKEYNRWGPTDGDKFDDLVKVGQKETIVRFAQRYPRARKETYNYSGLDANIIGVVAQTLLESKKPWQPYESVLWKHIGAKEEARLKIDKEETGIGACCLYLRIYDLARFGLFVLHKGRDANGKQVIPAVWFDLATRLQPGSGDEIPSGNDSYNDNCPLGAFNYRYQWWLLPKRTDFTAIGIDGQFLHIYPDADGFIAQISDWSKWTNGDYLECETFSFHDALIDALK